VISVPERHRQADGRLAVAHNRAPAVASRVKKEARKLLFLHMRRKI